MTDKERKTPPGPEKGTPEHGEARIEKEMERIAETNLPKEGEGKDREKRDDRKT